MSNELVPLVMVMPMLPFYIESMGASAIGFGLLLGADSLGTVLLTTRLFTVLNALLRLAVIVLTCKQAESGQGVEAGAGERRIWDPRSCVVAGYYNELAKERNRATVPPSRRVPLAGMVAPRLGRDCQEKPA